MICEICGKEFQKKKNSKTCSPECGKEKRERYLKDYNEKHTRVLSEETLKKNRERAKKYYEEKKKKSTK